MAEAELAKLKTFTVEGGLTLYAVSPADAQAEAFANQDGQVYFGKGMVTLKEGDCILDLGANVGSFARMAAPVLGPRGKVYALEPIPDVYLALRLNKGAYEQWAKKNKLPVADIIPIHAGCGDEDSLPQREFTYYPKITAMSTMYRDEPDAAQATYSLVVHRPQSFSMIENFGKALARCLPGVYHAIHCLAFTHLLLRPAKKVVCPMTTVSQLIAQHKIKQVDLLKMNVERAEADCLAGIAEVDWPKIKQVSAQVHDIDGRVKQTVELLQSKGFWVSTYQEPRFRACCLHMVYGTRRL